MKRALITRVIVILVFTLLIAAIALLKKDSYISEYIFARGFSRFYLQAVSTVTSLLPFSLYEVLAAAAVAAAIVFLVRLIKRLKRKQFALALKKALSAAAIVLGVLLAYNASASFSYSRPPMSLNIEGEKPENDEVYDAALFFMEDFGELARSFERDGDGNIIPPYGFFELSGAIKGEFEKLGGDYFGPALTAKPMVFSKLMSYLGFSGVFMSITGEPNINRDIPPCQLPIVMAHEMAHSAGVMREDEANLLSYYLLLNSQDGYLRYSAYMSTFGQILAAVRYACGNDEYQQIYELYDPLILQEASNSRKYWMEHDSFIDSVTGFFNDLYLKLSGVKSGTDSYARPGDYEVIEGGQDENGEPIIIDIRYSDIQYVYFDIFRKLSA